MAALSLCKALSSLGVLLASVGWAGLLAAAALAAPIDEDRLRAAFVLRLAQYTQWPQPFRDGEAPLCLAGVTQGEAALQALAQRELGGARLTVRVIEHPRQAIEQCRVLLLGHADAQSLRRWMAALGDAPVLVLGTSPEALRAGVTIALLSEPQGMAFSVNHGEATRRGLTLAAPVLKLAREIR